MSENKENILFIIPSFFFIGEYQKRLYFNDIPVGTLQLSSLLKEKADVETQIIDIRVESEGDQNLAAALPKDIKFKEGLLRVLERNNIQDYLNVGINCYTSYHYPQTTEIAHIIRENYPNVNILVGGYHPTAVPEDFSYNGSPYDFIIQGEADLVLLNLFRQNILKKSAKKPKREVIFSQESIDVNILPFPDYELFLTQYPFKDKFRFEIYASRGCPYQCAFCAENYEFRSYKFDIFKEHFIKLTEIIQNYNKEVPKMTFADQSFDRVLINDKILDFILENELNKSFLFSCQSRVETLGSRLELIDKYRKCNMIVGYGLETINKILLKEMKKTDNPTSYIQTAKNIIKKYKSNGDPYGRINLLIGFPGETGSSLNETAEFINAHAIHPNLQISPTLFSNYPNVFVYQNMEYYEKKFGTEFKRKWWKLPSNSFKNSIPTKPSRNYTLKEMLIDYKDKYVSILKEFKRDTFSDIVNWKLFFNSWIKEL